MKKIFVKDIKEKDRIEEVFLVSKKESGVTKNGKPYLNLRLMDSTGDIEARVWDDVDSIANLFDKNDFVIVKGAAISYQRNIQLNISQVNKIPSQDIDVSMFLPLSKYNPDEMFRELEEIVTSIKDVYIKKLLTILLSDGEISRLLKLAPAAKSIHHTYLGGLLEHILSLAKLTRDVSSHYPHLNKDILIAGAVLHDIGKIYELSYEGAFDYTDEGKMLGHITIGVDMLEKKISQIPDFPKKTTLLLKHMILSHHGHLEYGSPKRPKTLEAVMLYYLDDLDSKIQSITALIEKEKGANSKWTTYHKSFDRYIFKDSSLTEEGSVSDKITEKEGYDNENKDLLALFKKV